MNKIISWVMRVLLFALPLFFLPITTEFYDFNKQALFAIGIILILILMIIKYAKTKTINFAVSPLTIPVVIFAVAAILTFFFNSPNKAESLAFPNGTGTIVLLTIWFLIVMNNIELRSIYTYLNPLLLSAVILSFFALVQYFRLGLNLVFPKVPWIAYQFWTPSGSPLILTLFISAIIPYPIIRLVEYIKNKKNTDTDTDSDTAVSNSAYSSRMIGFGAAAGLLTLTLALMVVSLLTNAKPILLPFQFGWMIAAEVMKGMQTAALGVGLLNYLPAFTTGHTAAFNSLPIWNVRFGVSTNYYLQLVTELGILGFAAYTIIIFRFIKRFLTYTQGVATKTLPYNPIFFAVSVGIIIIFISQLFVPANLIQLIVLFTLLGIFAKYITTKTYTEKSAVVYVLVLAASVISIFFASITIYNVYSAEVFLKASLNAAQKNKIDNAYKLQQKAIQANPYVDKYHSVFAQTNLALAVALSKKENLSEEDRTTLAKLLAQAAQSGKNAIATSPTNVQNWENLGNIYRAMIGAVQNADSWTLQAYSQAARLDPANPNLRLAIGGVYYSAKNYDAAATNFLQAANLKGNYANAYYNLAAAYREKKEWAKAAQAMQAAINNLPRESEDRKKAEGELDEIRKNIPQQSSDSALKDTTQNGTQVNPVNPPVVVPDNASPEDVINRQPSPTPRPSATPGQ